MHSYYVGMQVYARMLDLHRQTGSTVTVDESDFITQMETGNYVTTKLVEQYTAGFGNTTLPSSTECDFKFDKPVLQAGDNIVGFFGPYVSPGVLAQRIVEDAARTVAPNAEDPGDNWQLEIDQPDAEDEDAPAAPQPNRRCIGWAPRERLRQEMMTALGHARITPEAFHSDNPSIPINTRLMNYIHYQLSETHGFVEGSVPRSKTGSTAQIMTAVLNDRNEVSIRGPYPATASIAFFASAFRYRVDISQHPQILAPYEGAPLIPNLERNRLQNPILNEHLYHTIFCDSNARLKRIVKSNFASKV